MVFLLCGALPSVAQQDSEDVSGLTCLEKEHDDSAAGMRMKVYLRGDDVQYIDSRSEKGSVVLRREYHFHRRTLVSVVETIHNKWDRHLGPLKNPKLVSTTMFNVEDDSCARRSEFLQQAKQLLADLREHRATFHSCGAPGG